MNINLIVVLIILLWHWFADFILQTDWQAKNKSTNNIALFTHVWIYTLSWGVLLYIFFPSLLCCLWFMPITFVCHLVTDYITSRINTKLYKQGKIHWFFVSIGFDQFLHFTQLLLTYYYLTNEKN